MNRRLHVRKAGEELTRSDIPDSYPEAIRLTGQDNDDLNFPESQSATS